MALPCFTSRKLNTKICLLLSQELFLGNKRPEGAAVFVASLSIMLYVFG